MTSSPNRRTVYVGLFIAIAIAILAGGVLTVGSLKDTFTQKITLHTVFSEVNGLKAGDNVWCAGLKVGVVKGLGFVDTAQIEVEILLDKHVATFIHKDAKAHLGSDGLIGNTIVVLGSGSPEAPIIEDGDTLQTEVSVGMSDVLPILQENNKNLLAITEDIKNLTAGLVAGEGTVGKLLKEDGLYTTVSEAVDSLVVASDNARKLTASLATFSSKLNKDGGLANDLVTDDQLFDTIQASVDQLKQTVERANGLIGTLQTSAANPDSAVGALLVDDEVGADLKTTLDNLAAGTVLLNEDLKAIQSNFLFRPYFRKQEREARKAAKAAAKP